jgi:DNA-binding transcriptional regulator YhcF (GntR family)
MPYRGPENRKAIAAIIRAARAKGKRVPTQRAIGEALGVSQNTVFYHMKLLKRKRR